MKQVIYTTPESDFVAKIETTDVINSVLNEGIEVYYIPLINKKMSTLVVTRDAYHQSPNYFKVTVKASPEITMDENVSVFTNDMKLRSFFKDLEVTFLVKKGVEVSTEMMEEASLLQIKFKRTVDSDEHEVLFSGE